MVLNYSCDQLRRVAASRILSLMINDTKVQKIFHSTKLFLNFFRKKVHKRDAFFLCTFCVLLSVSLVCKERHGGHQEQSACSPRSVSALCKETPFALHFFILSFLNTFRYSPCSPKVVDDGPARAIPLSVAGKGARQGHPCQATFRI